jgi:hypothetical protein
MNLGGAGSGSQSIGSLGLALALAVIAVVVVVTPYHRNSVRLRREGDRLRDMARSNGWQVRRRGGWYVRRRGLLAKPYRSSGRVRNLVYGTDHGRSFAAFTHIGRYPGSLDTGVACLIDLSYRLAEVAVTEAFLEPTPARGTVRVSSDEDFNQYYLVRAKDPDQASLILNSAAISQLMTWKRQGWRISRSTLTAWSSGRMTASSIRERLDEIATIANLIPDVLREHDIS